MTQKIAIVVRDDLATWQKLNVTAFLMSGIAGASPEIIGEAYRDADNKAYHSLCIQPKIVLSADRASLKTYIGARWTGNFGTAFISKKCSRRGTTRQTGRCSHNKDRKVPSERHTARFPANRFADVQITIRQGRVLDSGDTHARGGPEAHFSRADIVAKYMELACPVIGAPRAAAIRDCGLDLWSPGSRFADLASLL